MTGRERIIAVLEGRIPDRIPVFPNIHFGTAHFGGITLKEFATDGKKNAACLIKAYKEFKYDAIKVGSDVAVEGEAVGSKVEYPEDNVPSMREPFLKEARVDTLKIPDPYRDGRMPLFIESTSIISQEVGNEAFIASLLQGPLNCASQIRGTENLLLDFYDHPVFVKELLSFSVQIAIEYGKALIKAGADCIIIGEALCSPAVISPSFYQEFVLEKDKELIKALSELGAKNVILHICGNIRKILKYIVETGTNIIDLDWQMDVSEVLETKEIKEAGITVCGNLNPAGVLLADNPKEVILEAKKLIEENKEKGRFILSAGCNMNTESVPKNLQAMVEAVDRFGWYSG
jgi:uroporphyrinogen decarboxylase